MNTTPNQPEDTSIRAFQDIILPIVIIILTAIGWYFVISQSRSVTQTTITAYQQTQLELVRSVAQNVDIYLHHQQDQLARIQPINQLQAEIFSQFVVPMRLENGNAWLSTPESVIFYVDSESPAKIQGKTMAEIFTSQAPPGASHYQAMAETIMGGREGVDWYVWRAGQGKAIAAWTPVMVGDQTWVIGLSTPLNKILESTGALSQIRILFLIMALASMLAIGSLIAWISSTRRRTQSERVLHEREAELRQIIDLVPHLIFAKNRRGEFILANQATAELLGATPEELGRPDYPELSIQNNEVSHFPLADPSLMESGQSQFITEETVKTATDESRVLQTVTIPFTTSRTSEPAILGVAIDITERKRAETEREQLLASEREQRELAEALRDTAIALNSTLNLDELLEQILTNIGRVVPHDTADIMLTRGDNVRVASSKGYLEHAFTPVQGMTFSVEDIPTLRQMAQTAQPLVIPNTEDHPDWLDIPVTRWVRSYTGAPLRSRNEIVGYLNLASITPHFFTPTHAQRLQVFADQAAIAVENARLFQAARQRVTELDAVRQATLGLTSSLELQSVLEAILESILSLTEGVHSAQIFLYQNERLTFGAAQRQDNLKNIPLTPDHPDDLTYTVAQEGKLIAIGDVHTHPLLAEKSLDWAGAIIGLPLKIGQRVVGVLDISYQQPRDWPETELQILHVLADQAAVAIENARLFEAEHAARKQAEVLREEARQNLAELTRLYELSTDFVSAMSVDEVAPRVIEKVVKATNAHSAVLNLLDDQGKFEQSFGPQEPSPRPDGTTMRICEEGQPLVIFDSEKESRGIPSHLTKKGIRASIGLPLKAGKQSIGVLFVRHSEPHHFSQREIETLFIFANQAAIAIQNARLYERVQQHNAELEEYVAEQTFELQVLYELAQALGHATQLTDVIRLVLLHLYQAIPYDMAASLVLSDTDVNLVFQCQHSFSSQLETHLTEIMTRTMETLGHEAIDDMGTEIHRLHPRGKTPSRPPLEALGSLIQVPIFVEEEPVGLLLIGAEQPNQFGPEQARLLRTAADQAAESIRRLQSLLAAEHRRLESLVAHLPTGVILLDSEHHIVLANPMAQEFLAMSTDLLQGDKLTQLGDQPLEAVLHPSKNGAPFEVPIQGPPHHLFEIMAKPMAVGSEAGSWLLVIRDITRERSTQKQIQQQERMAAVGQLAAGIAHDFNNILTSIIGYADMLQREPDLPQQAKEDLSRINSQGRRAAHLVRQILDFSRQSITEKRPLDLVPFMKETIKLLERTIPENIHISLEIEPSDNVPYTLNADLTQLQQVLTNLAVNARDAMSAGGALQFRLTPFELKSEGSPPAPEMLPGTWVAISISDSGSGILPEHRPHIFEPFFTTKAAGKGTGLGLAQVYGIVTEHGGCIQVESEVNKGSIFTIYLPVQTSEVEETYHSDPADTPHGHGEVILVVEDDPTVLETSQAMLQFLGYKVLTATNGRHALEIFEKHQAEIGLVLTDITMPDMGGIPLSKALHQQNPALRVVALTGYPLDNNREAKSWLAEGIVDWLQKPLSLEILAQTVRRWLN